MTANSPVWSINPRTGERVEDVGAETAPAALSAITDQAGQAAAQLQDFSRGARAQLLAAIADELDTDRSVLVEVADRETALGPDRLASELDRTLYQLRAFAEIVEQGRYLEAVVEHRRDDTPLGVTPDLRRLLVPVGPVAVFAASNFPFAFSVVGGDTAAALAAGCPVIVKAHPGHPATSRRTLVAAERAVTAVRAPVGTLALVFGFDAGCRLVESPAVRAVSFTGSAAGGRALFDIACARPDPIPFYGELAATNPIVVTPAAARRRAQEIARGLLDSVLLGHGQFCTKPGLVFVPASHDGDRLLDTLGTELRTRTVGPLLTSSIRDNFRATVDSLTSLPGVRTLRGRADGERGFSVVPTAITVDIADFSAELTAECFGPATVCVRYRGIDDLIDTLRSLPGSLAGAVHAEPGEDDHIAQRVLRCLRDNVGRLVFNGYPTGVAVNPAMTHGGPWPATTNSLHSSVGTTAIRRFLRPVTWQNVPDALLPTELRDGEQSVPRIIDGARQF